MVSEIGAVGRLANKLLLQRGARSARSACGGTTINGQSTPFLINANLVDDLIVDMNGGNDRVMVNQLHLNSTSHADLVIETGDGNAVADLKLAEAILSTWLPSLELLVEPQRCDIPI